MVCLENVSKISLQDVFKMSWRHLQDVFKTSWRRIEDALKRSWRRFENILKTSSKRLEDIWPRRIHWSWPRRFEDVFWRRRRKTSSSRRMFAGWVQFYLAKLCSRGKHCTTASLKKVPPLKVDVFNTWGS